MPIRLPYRAAVQHGQMPDGHPRTDEQGKPRIGVQHGAVLHIAAGTDLDTLIVGPDGDRKPHARVLAQHDVPDDSSIRCHETPRRERGGASLQRVDHC